MQVPPIKLTNQTTRTVSWRRLLVASFVPALLIASGPLLLFSLCALPLPCAAQDTPTDAHDDFWQFMNETDHARDLRKLKERRDEELERQMEDTIENRAMSMKKRPLYGDVKSQRLKLGVGDKSLGDLGGDKIVGTDDLFSKDKFTGNDFMISRLSESDARDDSVRPGPLGPLKKKITHADDADDQEVDPRTDEWKRLLKTNYAVGDWAPSPVDLLDNGGFTHQKDNGRPVPYRLNGHINVNRGLPWDTAD